MKQEQQKGKVCAIIAFGDEYILSLVSAIVEQIANAGVNHFLVGFKKPFNKWATFACYLLNNKYRHLTVKTIEVLDDVYFKAIPKSNKNKSKPDVQYYLNCYSKEEIYKAMIDVSDMVVTDKTKPEVAKYAEENNKPVIFIN